MANILLGVTGSVAAIRVPELYAAPRERGFAVKIVATPSATYFFDPAVIEPVATGTRNRSGPVPLRGRVGWEGRHFCLAGVWDSLPNSCRPLL